jgi:hypothetical protein
MYQAWRDDRCIVLTLYLMRTGRIVVQSVRFYLCLIKQHVRKMYEAGATATRVLNLGSKWCILSSRPDP